MSKVAPKTIRKKYKVDWMRILLIGFVVYFVIVFTNQQLQINEYNVKLDDINTKIEESKTETEEMKAIKNRTDDSEYIESVAREELGLVKPYEKIFIDVNK